MPCALSLLDGRGSSYPIWHSIWKASLACAIRFTRGAKPSALSPTVLLHAGQMAQAVSAGKLRKAQAGYRPGACTRGQGPAGELTNLHEGIPGFPVKTFPRQVQSQLRLLVLSKELLAPSARLWHIIPEAACAARSDQCVSSCSPLVTTV